MGRWEMPPRRRRRSPHASHSLSFAVSSLLAVSASRRGAGRRAGRVLGRRQRPAAMSRSAANRTTLCLLNEQRRAHGLARCELDRKLGRAAAGHARDMVAKRYFAHDSEAAPPSAPASSARAGPRSRRSYTIGENIGWGGGSLATPRSMVRGWMNSAGHRANILSRQLPHDRHRHRQRRPDRRLRRDLRHRLRRLSLPPRTSSPRLTARFGGAVGVRDNR